jgi:hypothetical protein
MELENTLTEEVAKFGYMETVLKSTQYVVANTVSLRQLR